jgi:hypothetical protein
VTECDAKLARYRAALDAGADSSSKKLGDMTTALRAAAPEHKLHVSRNLGLASPTAQKHKRCGQKSILPRTSRPARMTMTP